MATGIVSKAVRLDGAATLSGALLGAGLVAYVLLAAAYAWRLARYRREFLADARDPARSFAFFTFVAGLPPGWPVTAIRSPPPRCWRPAGPDACCPAPACRC